MKKKLVAALLLASVLGVAQARSTAMVQPDRVTLPAGGAAPLSVDAVHQAVLRGASRFEWTVVSDEPGKVRLRHTKQNKHEAIVEVGYDATGYQIRYVSSVNLNYADKNGAAVIHPLYNTWIANLGRAITTEAAVTAPAQ